MNLAFCTLRILFQIAAFCQSLLAEDAVPPERIAAWIGLLDSDDFELREHAYKSLVLTGTPVVSPLRAELAKQKGAEFQKRAKAILDLLVDGLGPVNGLKLELRAENTTLEPGQFVTFHSKLTNLTDKSVKVRLGGQSGHANGLVNGEHLRYLALDPVKLQYKVIGPSDLGLTNMSMVRPRVEEIKANASLDFKVQVAYLPRNFAAALPKDNKSKVVPQSLWRDDAPDGFIIGGFVWGIAVPSAPSHRFCMTLELDNDSLHLRGTNLDFVTDRFRMGEIQSNIVEIKTVK